MSISITAKVQGHPLSIGSKLANTSISYLYKRKYTMSNNHFNVLTSAFANAAIIIIIIILDPFSCELKFNQSWEILHKKITCSTNHLQKANFSIDSI